MTANGSQAISLSGNSRMSVTKPAFNFTKEIIFFIFDCDKDVVSPNRCKINSAKQDVKTETLPFLFIV